MASEIVYAPVNRCIYCGATETLGKEHIIPRSLAGMLILPRASCRTCERTTSGFELTVARRIYGNFRMKHDLPSYRKDERPTHIPLEFTQDDGTPSGTVMLP